jgi:FMN reductase
MALNATIVIGNPKPMSRTLKVAETQVEKLLVPGYYDFEIIDIANQTAEIFAWPSGCNDAAAGALAPLRFRKETRS